MTNKQIATLGIVSLSLFVLIYLADENSDGFMYWLSLAGFYTSVIWGWNRLMKSDN